MNFDLHLCGEKTSAFCWYLELRALVVRGDLDQLTRLVSRGFEFVGVQILQKRAEGAWVKGSDLGTAAVKNAVVVKSERQTSR